MLKVGDRVVITGSPYTAVGPTNGMTGEIVYATVGVPFPYAVRVEGMVDEHEDAYWMFSEGEIAAIEIPMQQEDAGLRFNTGKLPYHLLPEDSVREMVKVLDFGSIKYDDWNWSKGMKWDSQVAASLQRHLVSWKLGEDVDQETGLHHMAHVMCNAAFLMHYYLNNKGEDDRYKYNLPSEDEE